MAIELRDKNLKALIDPSRGAGVLAFAAERDGRWLDLMPNTTAESDLACASF